jgi:penicillin-binding protein 1C
VRVRPLDLVSRWGRIFRKGWNRVWNRRLFRLSFLSLGSLLLLFLFLRYSPLPQDPGAPGNSAAFLAADDSLLRMRLSSDGTYRLPIPLGEVSPQVVQGFVAYEDKWFWLHPGVNPVAVLRALRLNFFSDHVLSGASTIPMQLAKQLDLRPRNFLSKLRETFRALQLEARYSKKEILEFYLNRVPMGGNLQGVGAASLFYFGRPVNELSWAEASLLISLPRSPTARRPDLHPEAALEGRNRVLDRLRGKLEKIPTEAEARQIPVPSRRFPNPRRAPQFVDRADQLAGFPSGVTRLTLDPAYQDLAAKRLREAVEGLKPRGVRNGSLIVVDNHTMEILAYVGSVNLEEKDGGQVNCANILRSPGSALKPFLYALSLDEGILTPRQILTDLPRDYGSFKPANYEGVFSGVVPAREALARSLNLPAVDLESQLQSRNGGLRQWIRGLGFGGEKRADLDPGLSMVLGGYPVTLEEMVSLYAALANGGFWRPLKFFRGETGMISTRKKILSPEASFLTTEMLSEVHRPDLPRSWEFSPTRSRVAFKTGTSFGYRDAWCVGVTPDYTIGVWLGNASAKGSSALIASETAAPVVLELFHEWTRSKDHWFSMPPGLALRKVCPLTGYPVGEACPLGVDDPYIPGVSRREPCDVHRKIFIRKSDGREACFACMTGSNKAYQEKTVEVWPPDVQWFFRKSGKKHEVIPDHVPGCTRTLSRSGPRILSPSPGAQYEIKASLPLPAQRVALVAQSGADVGELYWFLGTRLIARGKPEEPLFWEPEPGRWEVTVVDSRGRSAMVSFSVFGKKSEPFVRVPEKMELPKGF